MAEKKKFLLRLDPVIYEALERWAADEYRSVNSHIEFLLRETLKKAGRLPRQGHTGDDSGPPSFNADE